MLRAREEEGERMYWDYDEHMKPQGYRVVGEALYAWWSNRPVV